MSSYDRLLQLNNLKKELLLECMKSSDVEEVRKMIKQESKWTFKKKNDKLYLVNDISNECVEIRHLGELLSFIKYQSYCYITNISFIKSNKKVLDNFVMTEEMWLNIKHYVRKIERFSILRVDDLQVYISKMLLMRKGVVVLETPLYSLVKLNEKEMILVTDLSIIILDERSFTFSGIESLRYIKISNVKLYEKGLGSKKSLHNMFSDCSSLKEVVFDNFDTKEVTDMGYMFDGCAELVSLNLSCFDTRCVHHMDNMFRDCGSLKYLDLEHFNVGMVKDFSGMFMYCMSLEELKINSWNIGEKRYGSLNLNNMFRCAENIQGLDIDKFKKLLEDQTVSTENMFRNTPYMDKV